MQSVEDIVGALFAPLFFATIALNVDFVGDFHLVSVLVVFVIGFIAKLIGGWAGAKLAGLKRRESWAIGAGMTARGAMEIILAELALEAGIIGNELFVAIVIMSLATSIIAGPAIEKILARPSGHNLTNLLKPSTVLLDLQANTASEALAELADAVKLPPQVVEAAIRREESMPTGMTDRWALPHARCDVLKTPVVVVGFARSGIDFLANDGSQSELLVFLATPEDADELHLQILAAIARVFGDRKIRNEILAAKNTSEVLAAIRMAEAEAQGHH